MLTPEFSPPRWFRHRHLQTIMGTLGRAQGPASERVVLPLDDGDALALEISLQENASATVVLVHGLGGSHASTYMCRVANSLYKQGLSVVRVNMRGAGSGMGLAKGFGHSGRSDDVVSVLKYLKTKQAPVLLIGFSLGGHQVLKALGELGDEAKLYAEGALAVCPPIDLAACVDHMRGQARGIYERYLLSKLKNTLRGYQKHFREFEKLAFEAIDSLYHFDDRITAPLSGYDNADIYYERCSSAPLLKRVSLPTHILYALDDPFIDARIFSRYELGAITTTAAPYGGHMGFLGFKPRRWMDVFILHWVVDRLTAIGAQETNQRDL